MVVHILISINVTIECCKNKLVFTNLRRSVRVLNCGGVVCCGTLFFSFLFFCFFFFLLFGVADAVRVDGKDRFGLGQARAVVDLADAGLAASLSEVQPRRGGVRHDVTSDRLLRVRCKHGTAVDLRDNLIGDHHRHSKLCAS